MINSTLLNSKILIVDDQEANIDILQGLLEMQGYHQIKATQDPRKVIELYKNFEPDLILLDLAMPYLSGFEVMDQLKQLVPENTYLPILVLTADVTTQSKQKALSGGAIDFLTKPFDLVEVGLRIKNLLYTSYLQKQLINQNQMLENKVRERTRALENQNIELIAAKEKAEASDRLKSAFINNISHEIRTPLNGILGFGQILTEESLSHEEKQDYAKMLNQSCERLLNTVTNIMDISMLSSGNQKVIQKQMNIDNSIDEVINKFKDLLDEKKLRFLCEATPDQSKINVLCDHNLFSKILYQLIDNAVKFTQQGTISVGYEENENELHIFVQDTGIGISPQKQAQIFETFSQEDNAITRKYEGVGLGLSIAKGFIELLKGRIWFTSEKGKGSAFYFSIPYNQPDSENQTSDSESGKVIKKATVLIAEDDEVNLMILKAFLGPEFEILQAANGMEAVELCRKYPSVDLVFMDLKMPELNGFEATKQIKVFRPDLPIVALTAYSDNEDKQRAIDSGCNDFITKPFKKDFILGKLKEFGIS